MASTRIEEVIGEFVSLKRRGSNYMACCPFHHEKTPSFAVSPTKGIYKCFGCGKSGNAAGFLMEHEQMSWVEALKYLAKKYGIEVREREENPEDAQMRLRRESVLAVSEFAQKYFARVLYDTPVGQAVGLSYFKNKRGFTDETIRKFGLGFAPDSRGYHHAEGTALPLTEAARKEGYRDEFLLAADLSLKRDDGSLYDKFYDRVMFPIHSLTGRVVAFGGRTLKDDKSVPKYVNSTTTEIYHKSESLYGMFFAKAAIARTKTKKCYLVEGYADVISMHQAGIENVVASSGTSLTVEQSKLIHRFADNVTVLYDGDAAGIKASIRGINILLEEGLRIKVVQLPEGEDPDTFARANGGEQTQAWLDAHEQDFIDFKSDILAEDMGRDPLRRADLIREIIDTIALIPDQVTRSVYIEQCSSKLGVAQDMLFQEVAKSRNKHLDKAEAEAQREQQRAERWEKAGLDPDGSGPLGRETQIVADNKLDSVAPAEKSLLFFLMRDGLYQIHFDDGQMSVSRYISNSLAQDDLELHVPVLKNLYDIYYRVEAQVTEAHIRDENFPDADVLQEEILHFFYNNLDPALTAEVMGITEIGPELTVAVFNKSLVRQENVLHLSVPKAVNVFKQRHVEYLCNSLIEDLGRAQAEGDSEAEGKILLTLSQLSQVRAILSKELNRM